MKYYSQYNEDQYIVNFFKKHNGVLIDIGAADGKINSNSRHLMEYYNWTGILVEPHPDYFKLLNELYFHRDDIKTYNFGVSDENKIFTFYKFENVENGQVSTFCELFKNKVESIYGKKYFESIDIQCITLQKLLEDNNVSFIDFMSIDCEGMDMKVLKSNNWNIFRPKLICIEHSMDKEILNSFMKSINYSKTHETVGNSFFTDDLVVD